MNTRSPLLVGILALSILATEAAQPLLAPANRPATVPLAWDAPTDTTDIAGYWLYWGPASGAYTNKIYIGGATTLTAIVGPLVRGQPYYFAATSYDAINDLESDFSNEVTATPHKLPGRPFLRLGLSSTGELIILHGEGEPGAQYELQKSEGQEWQYLAILSANPEGDFAFAERLNTGSRFYRTVAN